MGPIQETNGQGCDSSFSKELSSQFKLPGHLELQFRSSSSYGMRELSYSSVQFHLLGQASKRPNSYQIVFKPALSTLILAPVYELDKNMELELSLS